MVNSVKQRQVKTKRPVKDATMPRLPHERDESDDSQSSGPRDDMKQAYRDITEGQVDTDRRGMRGVEKVVNTPDAPDTNAAKVTRKNAATE